MMPLCCYVIFAAQEKFNMQKFEISKKQIIRIMIGVMTGVLLSALDSTIVGTAMPRIIGELQGMDRYSWPFTAYMLFSTSAAIIFGKLADIYGRKIIFLSGLLIFISASVLCGLSANMTMLIVFRGMQGLGGGILISNAFAIAGELFQGKERGKAMGFIGSMFGLASILGPALGGFITDHLGWRWIFYVNIPVGIISISLIALNLSGKMEEKIKHRIDAGGIVCFIMCIIPLLLALSWGGREKAWNSSLILGLFGISLISLIAFIRVESAAAEPILPLRLFRNRVFNLTMTGAFFSNMVFYGAILFLPLYLQEVQKMSASLSGFLLTPMMIAFTAASVMSGQIASRIGKTKSVSVAGFLLALIGCGMLSLLSQDTAKTYSLSAMIILGVGLGITTPIFNLNAQSVFPVNMIGLLTGTVQFFRSVGGTLGIAMFGSLLMQYIKNGIPKLDWGLTPASVRTLLSDPKILMNTSALEGIKTKVPEAYRGFMEGIFHQLEGLLSSGIAYIFLAALIAAVLAMVSGLFQKECYLKGRAPVGQGKPDRQNGVSMDI
jgi:EmrB/QacA subfamily drug resistance transporter